MTAGYRHVCFLSVLIALCCAQIAWAAAQSSTNYSITADLLSSGGGFSSSTSYSLLSSLGHSTETSVTSSSNYMAYSGFLHPTAPLITEGDINGDGLIDLTDAMLALQVLSGMSLPDIHSGADVNSDGEIGTAEVIFILGKVSGFRE